jgi:two-component system response regulator EvgA
VQGRRPERTGQCHQGGTFGYNYFPSQALNPVRSDEVRYAELELFKSVNDRELMVLQFLPKGAPTRKLPKACFSATRLSAPIKNA